MTDHHVGSRLGHLRMCPTRKPDNVGDSGQREGSITRGSGTHEQYKLEIDLDSGFYDGKCWGHEGRKAM